MSNESADCLVIGGGLPSAWELRRAGLSAALAGRSGGGGGLLGERNIRKSKAWPSITGTTATTGRWHWPL